MCIALASDIMPSINTGASIRRPSLISLSRTNIISWALPTAGTGINTFPPTDKVLLIASVKVLYTAD